MKSFAQRDVLLISRKRIENDNNHLTVSKEKNEKLTKDLVSSSSERNVCSNTIWGWDEKIGDFVLYIFHVGGGEYEMGESNIRKPSSKHFLNYFTETFRYSPFYWLRVGRVVLSTIHWNCSNIVSFTETITSAMMKGNTKSQLLKLSILIWCASENKRIELSLRIVGKLCNDIYTFQFFWIAHSHDWPKIYYI